MAIFVLLVIVIGGTVWVAEATHSRQELERRVAELERQMRELRPEEPSNP